MNAHTASLINTFLISIALTASAHSNTLEACPAADNVAATYEIQHSEDNAQSETIRTIQLLRNQHQVAIHYVDTDVTELWEQTPNNRLHLQRLFDHHRRGIEYQANEIKGPHDWSLKRQMISNALLTRMTLEKVTGHGCDTTESYSLQDHQRTLAIEWQPHRKLLLQLKETQPTSTTLWMLVSQSTDQSITDEAFATWNEYQTTDYTDIGDNESDPFLRQMIHLGFVQHGASGFYDAEGKTQEHHH